MKKEAQHDLVINGYGSATGGLFNKVEINGRGKVDSDLECIELECNGSTRIEGRVKAEEAEINGALSMTGHLEADRIHISGKATVQGNLIGENVRIEGAARVKGDCEAEKFEAEGALTIDGLLNAGEIEIELYGNCKVKEIGGERIRICEGPETFSLIKRIFMPSGGLKLTTQLIEGNDIHLEHTHAQIVRGNNVTIGEGCQIDQVEYHDTFHKVDEAEVHNYKKIV